MLWHHVMHLSCSQSYAMIILFHRSNKYVTVSKIIFQISTVIDYYNLSIIVLFFYINFVNFLELKMTEDVAGATFMAIASSSPELFINTVGTFVTEGDIGVGTIVGSAVFNILAVPACCGLIAGQVYSHPIFTFCL